VWRGGARSPSGRESLSALFSTRSASGPELDTSSSTARTAWTAPGTRTTSIDFDDARHPQTILAYEINDRPLPVEYGAPLRLRVERQLGYKMAKYVMRVELVETFAAIGRGKGGYWEDRGYEWYAGI